MTEIPTTTSVLYGSAKAEQVKPPKPEQSKAVSGVRKAVDNWLDRIGTKDVEQHFIKAHENILATLNSDQRKEVFAKQAENWQKAGKIAGITATVIDGALAGVGIGLTVLGRRNPDMAFAQAAALPTLIIPINNQDGYRQWLANTTGKISPFPDPGKDPAMLYLNKLAYKKIGKNIALIPTLGSLGILLGSGPGHWLAHLAAGATEQIGKTQARTNNYVDSGKAAEHAKKVGSAIGKGLTETAKYAAEHPDEIRRTVETVSRVNRQNAESAQHIAESKQRAADIALDKEYQDWLTHHPDKAYYQNSGQPMPSKADYVEMKRREAAAKKANEEVLKRGLAKH